MSQNHNLLSCAVLEPLSYDVSGYSALTNAVPPDLFWNFDNNDYSWLNTGDTTTSNPLEKRFSSLTINGLDDPFTESFTTSGVNLSFPAGPSDIQNYQVAPPTQSVTPYQHQIEQSRREIKGIRRKKVLRKFYLSRVGRKGYDVLVFTIDDNGRARSDFFGDSELDTTFIDLVPTRHSPGSCQTTSNSPHSLTHNVSPPTITDPDIATPNVNTETRCLCGITDYRGNLMIQW
jgi:hypothetical protein